MKRRLFSLILCISILSGVLAGCGGGNLTTNKNTQDSTQQSTENNVQSTEDIVQEPKPFIFEEIEVRMALDENNGMVTSGAYGGHDSHLIFQIISGHLFNDSKADGAYSRLYNQSSFRTGRENLQDVFRVKYDYDRRLEVERCGTVISNDGVTYTEISEGDEVASTDNLTAAQIFKVYVEDSVDETYVLMTYRFVPHHEGYSDNWEMTGLYSPYHITKYFPNFTEYESPYSKLYNLSDGASKFIILSKWHRYMCYVKNDMLYMHVYTNLDEDGDGRDDSAYVSLPVSDDMKLYYHKSSLDSPCYVYTNGILMQWNTENGAGSFVNYDYGISTSESKKLIEITLDDFYDSFDDAFNNPIVYVRN